ncbi:MULTISPECIES: DUF397 domain-containing protein [unclassified Spirillospora]|uniref:DUF397 domain-containing protein n=1 Tax=unclassified Spirillospora TaxID=2642701 RepID=UPI00372158EF
MTKPDLSAVNWRKSSRSGHEGGACVEVASAAPGFAVRDSKNPDGPKLTFGNAAWREFTSHIKANAHDLP